MREVLDDAAPSSSPARPMTLQGHLDDVGTEGLGVGGEYKIENKNIFATATMTFGGGILFLQHWCVFGSSENSSHPPIF